MRAWKGDGKRMALQSGKQQATGRREFMRCCGRWTLRALGAVAGARLLGRRQISAAGQRCVNDGICSSCRTYAECGLPQALSRRRAMQGKEGA